LRKGKEVSKKSVKVVEVVGSKSSVMIDEWKKGVELSSISKSLNVRYQFVNNVVHRYCKKNHIPFTTNKVEGDSKKSLILRLRNEENREIKEIANILKTNKSYVWQVIDEDRQSK
jgi:hypothetical protein